MQTGIVVELFNKERAGGNEYITGKNVKSDNPLAFKNILSEKISENIKNTTDDKEQPGTGTETEKSEKNPFFSIISSLGLTEGTGNTEESGDTNSSSDILSLFQKLIETASRMELSQNEKGEKERGLKTLLTDGTDGKGLEALLTDGTDGKGLKALLTDGTDDGKGLEALLTDGTDDGKGLEALLTDGTDSKGEKISITDLLEEETVNINPGSILSSFITKGNHITEGNKEIKENKTDDVKDENQESSIQDIQQILASFLTSLKEVANLSNNGKVNGETPSQAQSGSAGDKILNTAIMKLNQDLNDFLSLTGKLEKYISEKNTENPFIQIDNDLLSKSPLISGAKGLMKEINNLLNSEQKDTENNMQEDMNIEKLESLISILEQNGIKQQKEEKNEGINISQYKDISLEKEEVEAGNDILLLKEQNIPVSLEIEKSVVKVDEKFQSNMSSEINISEQIVKKINWKTNEKYSEASITLDPESLGRVRVEIISAGGEVSAKFYTNTKESGDLLRQQLNQLRESLSSQGLKLGEFSVLLNQQNMPSFNNQSGYSFQGKKYTPTPEQVKLEIDKSRTRIKTSSSQMDYFV